MVAVESSFEVLKSIEDDERIPTEDLIAFGYGEDLMDFYTNYEEVIDSIVMFIHEPESGEYIYDNFNVIKTFYRTYYNQRYHAETIHHSYHIIDVDNEDYYIGVWFELEPWEYDRDFGVLDYHYRERRVTLLKKGYYTDYLLAIDNINQLI